MGGTCNPELATLLARWRFERDELIARGASEDALAELDGERLSVFVTIDGPPTLLEDSALSVGFFDGAVATGTIRIADVEAFLNLKGVVRVNLAARAVAHIDRSMADIKVDAIRSKAPPYTSTGGARAYTGKGVLIGIIDDSIYERHPSFLKPGANMRLRKTRIVGIWDQRPRHKPGGPPSPPGFGYGTFWDEAAINDVLAAGIAGLSAIPLASAIDHGSHVTGIAAANGSFADGPAKPFTLVGVAPEADIVFCNAIQYDPTGTAVSDAVNFIFRLAASRGQACVINMSFGTHEGARDGSSDLERAIDRALTTPDGKPIPGRAVVVSAGNEADMGRHSRKLIMAGGALSFRMRVGEFTFPSGFRVDKPKIPGDKILGKDQLFIWYSASASIDIRVTPPGGVADPPGWTPFDEIRVSPSVIVASGLPTPSNGKKYIVVTLWAPVRNGEWRLELRERAGVETPVDIWVDRVNDGYIYPRFVDQDDIVANTITCPATARHVIAVGGYICTPGPNETAGAIYKASSRGLDSAYMASADETRPHLVAPARRIVSANNSSHADEAAGVDIMKARYGGPLMLHALMTGTSQAAPHVTGVIALMFEKNPGLTAPQIRSILTSTANRTQIDILEFPNRVWGYGRLDAKAALAAVP